MSTWVLAILLMGCLERIVFCYDGEVFYSRLGMQSFLPGKSCADIYHINKVSRERSGYYWIRSNTTSLSRVYCDMELECGGVKGGWMRVAYLDMTQEHSCPPPWIRIVMPGTSQYVYMSIPFSLRLLLYLLFHLWSCLQQGLWSS